MSKNTWGARIFNVGALVALILSLVMTGFLFIQTRKQTENIATLEAAKSEESVRLEDFKSQKQIYPKIRAYQLLEVAQSNRIQWSKVLQDILKYQSADLDFDTFSSDKDRLISLNGWSRTMEGVAQFLENIKIDPKIEDPFLAGVSKSIRQERPGFSFTISFHYRDF